VLPAYFFDLLKFTHSITRAMRFKIQSPSSLFLLRAVTLSLIHSITQPLNHTFAQTPEAAMLRQGLVDVQTLDPTILVELKYATTDNFVKTNVYGTLRKAYLQPMAAERLVKASTYLRQQQPELRLLVYDAARPRSAQWKLWNALKLPEKQRKTYVADPREGSIHNYGCAVDLTLARVRNGRVQPLDMGTPFDFFGERAYPKAEDKLLKSGQLTAEQVRNRRLLRSVMQRAGYMPIEYEWWHFNAVSRVRAKGMFRIIKD